MNYFKLLILPVVTLFIAGCEKSDEHLPVSTGFSKGIYIVNEGAYTHNDGSISFFDPDSNLITNGIFEAANGRPLGDIVQSMSVVNDSVGIIVVNNSAKIEIVSLKTFKTKVNPIPVVYPRYFLQVNEEKGYLSSGSLQGCLYILELNSFTITDSIVTGFGPETLLKLGNNVYVANSGGWAADSTLFVINALTDLVVDTVKTGLVPVDMTLDSEENIWVYSKGYTNYADIETDAFIQKIDPQTNTVIWQQKVGTALDYTSTPARCAGSKDGSVIYYLRPDGVYRLNSSLPELQENPLIPGNFYGLDVNPANGNIYVFESIFSGNGTMKIFDAEGNPVAEGTVGIGPNGAVFNL